MSSNDGQPGRQTRRLALRFSKGDGTSQPSTYLRPLGDYSDVFLFDDFRNVKDVLPCYLDHVSR